MQYIIAQLLYNKTQLNNKKRIKYNAIIEVDKFKYI